MFVVALRLRAGCKVAAVEPAGTCPEKYELEAQWDPKTPWTTGAGHEITTQRLRCPARPRRARKRVHRPDVPERLCAAVAAHQWRGVVSAWPPGPALRVDGGGGAKDRGVRGQHRAVRSRRRGGPGELFQAPAPRRHEAEGPRP